MAILNVVRQKKGFKKQAKLMEQRKLKKANQLCTDLKEHKSRCYIKKIKLENKLKITRNNLIFFNQHNRSLIFFFMDNKNTIV